jgi:hypothetical protein
MYLLISIVYRTGSIVCVTGSLRRFTVIEPVVQPVHNG